jgi:hypothetical protein
MNGVHLKKLAADDMVDVIHCLFEDDASGMTREQFETRARFREIIYHDFYGINYPFKLKKPEDPRQPRIDGPMEQGPGLTGAGAPVPVARGASGPGQPDTSNFVPPIPKATGVVVQRKPAPAVPTTSADGLVHKPYTPPTDMNMGSNPFKPFAGLDAPMF